MSEPSVPELAPTDPAEPKGFWSRAMATIPIALTVLATIFAGVSSSEMTQSMYFRSLAAQHQAKAGDQWGFFQAKRIRGTTLEGTVEILRSLAHAEEAVSPREIETIVRAWVKEIGAGGSKADSSAAVQAVDRDLAALSGADSDAGPLRYLKGADVPQPPEARLPEPEGALAEAVRAIRERRPEAETSALIRKVSVEEIERAIAAVEQAAEAFDRAVEPVMQATQTVDSALKRLGKGLAALAGSSSPGRKESQDKVLERLHQVQTQWKAAAMDFDARRYRAEANYNRRAGELYEVRVRRSSFESDRHRERSKKFFYCMLLSQAGVTIASLALAGSRRSVLWLLAAAAGAAALAFSGYIYLT